MNKIELLAPAGDMEKLRTAIYFGADAVYVSGKQLGLRAFAANFEINQMKEAVRFAHEKGKKAYVTVNVFARNSDFENLKEYLNFLEEAAVDAVIVSDIGLIDFIKTNSNLKIHLSTQANALNMHAVRFYSKYVERVVLARELSLTEIAKIHEYNPQTELEVFVHGAMCISYSGRCLISDYLAGRASNRGECVQSCRYEYGLVDRITGEDLTIQEDSRGTYILNSKDLNMLPYISKLADAGVTSFKIEGRAKSVYYCAGVVNAYRRALDAFYSDISPQNELFDEPEKISHRSYTTGFYFGKYEQNHETSKVRQSYDFIAVVKEKRADGIVVEHRNRFKIGDILEVLSPSNAFLKQLEIESMSDLDGNPIIDANRVQQLIFIPTDLDLNTGDILRRKNNGF